MKEEKKREKENCQNEKKNWTSSSFVKFSNLLWCEFADGVKPDQLTTFMFPTRTVCKDVQPSAFRLFASISFVSVYIMFKFS